MAPEGHGAQVLPVPDMGFKKVTCPLKLGVPCNFSFLKCLQKHTADAPEAPWTPITHPVP